MEAGVDTGPLLSQRSTPILAEDTAGSLSQRLSVMGAELLMDTLPGYLRGEIQPAAQDAAQATKAPMLERENGQLDFNQPAEYLARRVRAYFPWPGTFSLWQGQVFKVLRAHEAAGPSARPGEETTWEGLPAWGTGSGLLALDEVQPAGKKAMPGAEFLRGARAWSKS
jgi:methionyl-tRNA formyltransferase